ncbi:MFS transporter [Stakelama tenebrarum]|uniref:MFS transporter n=1 Tax=Stakelama tenebrarum TaxID=2711215 RepID=A0A6G6Y346_9SPHN|nr:MFS transporter [Sphingosinithalassobacter tenebrarum]QIG79345.1 MFS transporter [Sphingosinithalassobacter tenebrarum]
MYLREFGTHWERFLSAAIGVGLGSALSYYTLSLFGPPLLEEFGWSKAEFALVGSLPLLTGILVPVAGRLTDRFGTRLAASVGFAGMTLGYFAYMFMSGNLTEFFAIYIVQHIFGILTTSLVFARVVVEKFDRARGIALSLLMTPPPLFGAIAAPLLGGLIDDHGWRAAYGALGLVTGAGGLTAILLMGRHRRREGPPPPPSRLSWAQFGQFLKHPTLILILIGMLLVNLPQAFATSQLKLVLMDGGVTNQTATWMMSVYAVGVIVGRFASGLALDRMPAHIVALAALGLPAIGYFLLVGEVTSLPVLVGAMSIVGFAQGAEADIGAFLISRKFHLENFSLLLSLLTTMVLTGSAVGALLMSWIVGSTGNYDAFLYVASVSTLVGATFFVLIGRTSARTEDARQS